MAENRRVECTLGKWAVEFPIYYILTMQLWESYLKARIYDKLIRYQENNGEGYVVPINAFLS